MELLAATTYFSSFSHADEQATSLDATYDKGIDAESFVSSVSADPIEPDGSQD